MGSADSVLYLLLAAWEGAWCLERLLEQSHPFADDEVEGVVWADGLDGLDGSLVIGGGVEGHSLWGGGLVGDHSFLLVRDSSIIPPGRWYVKLPYSPVAVTSTSISRTGAAK